MRTRRLQHHVTNMSLQDGAARASSLVSDGYANVMQVALRLQKSLESYFLRQEAYIRQRVVLLDEMQATISDERHCLEAQHHECRLRIRSLRQRLSFLQDERYQATSMCSHVEATLAKDESVTEELLKSLAQQLAAEDEALGSLLDEKYKLELEEQALDLREAQQEKEENELERTSRVTSALRTEIAQRKELLERKRQTIQECNEALEAREKELVRCQDQLRDYMCELERDESRLGVQRAATSLVAPVISQREVMDDFDMSIEHETHCEEIDYDDD